MVYLCLDTNIYIRLLTTLEERRYEKTDGDSNPFIEELRLLSSGNVLKILLPEVIELELIKHNSTFKKDYIENYNKLINSVSEIIDGLWNEVKDIKKVLLRAIDEVKDKKISHWENLYKHLENFLKSEDVERIKLTSDIMCITEKRRISGAITQSQINDSYLIDCIYTYADMNCITQDDTIYFITENKHDFFENNCENGTYSLKECFSKTQYKVIGLYSLAQYSKYINLDICESLSPKSDSFNSEQDICKFYEIVQNDINNMFEEKIKKSPEYLRKIRSEMLCDITDLLDKCRKTKSWDDRSELKLYQWLKDRSENELPTSKLSDLVLIKDDLQEYLQIHLTMDAETNN